MKKTLFVILSFLFISNQLSAIQNQTLEKAIRFFNDEKYDKAKTAFLERLDEEKEDDTAIFYLGRIFLLEENTEKAIELFEWAIHFNETKGDYHFWLGQAFGVQAKEANVFYRPFLALKSRNAFIKAVEYDPDHLKARYYLAQYYIIAPSLLGGSEEEAFRQAEKITERNLFQGYYAYTFIYEYLKDYVKAEEQYQMSIEKFPDNLDAKYQLGYFYGRTQQYNKAFEIFESIIHDYPKNMNAYYQIGRVGAVSKERLERSEKCLKQYIEGDLTENDPSPPWAYYWLGVIYESQQKSGEAIQSYSEALRLEPTFEYAKTALERLQ